jgi:thiamine biosynthesis lipoprotein
MSDTEAISPVIDPGAVHRFGHVAMNTPLVVAIAGEDPTYAEQAASAAFKEADRIELLLSRFNPSSELSQINALRAGQFVRVSPDLLDCLLAAERIWRQTEGAFDINTGPLRDCWRDEQGREKHPAPDQIAKAMARTGMEHLRFCPEKFAVAVVTDGIGLDLGAIGKGFAADRMTDVLRSPYLIRSALVGGASTVYALGSPPGESSWPLALSDLAGQRPLGFVRLSNAALGASGTEYQGRHILDPREGRPADCRACTYCIAPTATEADALSTAFAVMSTDEVDRYCREHPGVSAVLIESAPEGPRVTCLGSPDWAPASPE